MQAVDIRQMAMPLRVLGGAVALVVLIAGVAALRGSNSSRREAPAAGTYKWAIENYGDPDARGFKGRKIVEFDFLGRTMFVHGGVTESNHSFGIAIDVNALANPLGTEGDMPAEVVRQWRLEGGGWGGDWSRPDPMHYETHLTPAEIRMRYRRDGSPRDWYVRELTGG